MMIRWSTYIVLKSIRKVGKLKTQSPIYCIHIIERMRLILYTHSQNVQCFKKNLQSDDNWILVCAKDEYGLQANMYAVICTHHRLHSTGAKQLTEVIMACFNDAYMRHTVSTSWPDANLCPKKLWLKSIKDIKNSLLSMYFLQSSEIYFTIPFCPQCELITDVITYQCYYNLQAY